MEKETLYLLLDIIFRNGSLKRLSRKGLDYSEIAVQQALAISEKLVDYRNEKVVLTQKGVDILKQLEIQYKKVNKNEWIEKDVKNRVDRMEKDFIFVPRQNDLSF